MDCAIWKFTCSAIFIVRLTLANYSYFYLVLFLLFWKCIGKLSAAAQQMWIQFFIHILVRRFHYWTRHHGIAYFYVLLWTILFLSLLEVADIIYSLDQKLVGFEEIWLLATSIISVPTSNWNLLQKWLHDRYLALSVGSYPTIFMIIVRWSVLLESFFLWKIQTLFVCEYYIWKCFLRVNAAQPDVLFIFLIGLLFPTSGWSSSTSMIALKLLVNIILLFGSACLSNDHSFDWYQIGPFNVD